LISKRKISNGVILTNVLNVLSTNSGFTSELKIGSDLLGFKPHKKNKVMIENIKKYQ
jgi:hypothetical protein